MAFFDREIPISHHTHISHSTHILCLILSCKGKYALRVYLAVGGYESSLLEDGGVRRHRYSPTGNGGLLGTYFNSPFLEPGTEVMQRVDAYINFTWGFGPLTRTASDFVTVSTF